jgi:hypothetical protein
MNSTSLTVVRTQAADTHTMFGRLLLSSVWPLICDSVRLTLSWPFRPRFKDALSGSAFLRQWSGRRNCSLAFHYRNPFRLIRLAVHLSYFGKSYVFHSAASSPTARWTPLLRYFTARPFGLEHRPSLSTEPFLAAAISDWHFSCARPSVVTRMMRVSCECARR